MLRYSGMSSVPGAPGSFAPGGSGNLMAGLELPFGGGQQYRQIQQENRPGAPKPTGVSPVRIFPPNAPGREGAIDVQSFQAMGNYPGAAGNLFGMQMQNPANIANAQFYGGPQLGQVPVGFQNKFVY